MLDAAGVPCSPILSVADAVEHPQVQARNMIVHAGDLRVAGNPIKLSAFDDPPTRRPAPVIRATFRSNIPAMIKLSAKIVVRGFTCRA